MIIVLMIAAIITVFIGDHRDTAVIAGVVLLNAGLGFSQARRAERAMDSLRTLAAPTVNVIRGSTPMVVAQRELVVGDVVVLDVGTVVPADCRLVDAPNLRVNEAMLTGESIPVEKRAAIGVLDALPDRRPISDRNDKVFMGTAVTSGRAVAIVEAIAMDTELGGIAQSIDAQDAPATPLQQRLAVLGRRIAYGAIGVCGVVFVVGVMAGEAPKRMLLAAVSLAVAAIPESLPAVVTISLALGAQRMAAHHAIIRNLPAVETLGSVTVIATDKTGTLTQGRMVVTRAWTPNGTLWNVAGNGYAPEGNITSRSGASTSRDHQTPVDDDALVALARASALCNDAALQAPRGDQLDWEAIGDPTEGALLAFAAKAGCDISGIANTYPRLGEVPFDSTRKAMTTVHDEGAGVVFAVTKGAVEVVVPASSPAHASVIEIADAWAADGMRVLVLSGSRHESLAAAWDDHEGARTIYGLVALSDPAREGVEAAIDAAHRAGIRTVMITGDHPMTALSIARSLGVGVGGSTGSGSDDGRMITGPALAAEGGAHLADHVEQIDVYARATSEQKLDIVEAWQATGAVVAMTGDGVNDAPALRRADIGIAMGRNGTEVAKEAADMVLADDNFVTIVAAVEEGRRIYDNIRRFVQYGLTGGTAEVWVMIVAPFLGLPLALLPAQILFINLLTHGLPGVALGVEAAEPDAMARPPRAADESIFGRGLWQRTLVGGMFMAAVSLGVAEWAYRSGRPWQTMLFSVLVLLQLGTALAVRSETASTFTLGVASNRFLVWSVVAMIGAQGAAVYVPGLQDLFATTALSLGDVAVVLIASTATFWFVEIDKLVGRRRAGRLSTRGGAAAVQP